MLYTASFFAQARFSPLVNHGFFVNATFLQYCFHWAIFSKQINKYVQERIISLIYVISV